MKKIIVALKIFFQINTDYGIRPGDVCEWIHQNPFKPVTAIVIDKKDGWLLFDVNSTRDDGSHCSHRDSKKECVFLLTYRLPVKK